MKLKYRILISLIYFSHFLSVILEYLNLPSHALCGMRLTEAYYIVIIYKVENYALYTRIKLH